MQTPWQKNIEFSKKWLSESVLPLWSTKGFDSKNQCFVETLSFQQEPADIPRRCMVQCRQIYSFLKAAELKTFPATEAKQMAEKSADYLLKYFAQPDGSFIHSVNTDNSPRETFADLYNQAFVLFALAQVFKFTAKEEYKNSALKLVNYLNTKRKVETGGFSEVEKDGSVSYKTNPHMHLFEGALAWLAIDESPEWRILADEIHQLAREKFIDKDLGILGEYFDENWNSLKVEGRFIYEPGHQFEWAWLLSWYEDLTGTNCRALRHRLLALSEKHGINPKNSTAYDELWSNFTPKLDSSRFWPQCERIKATVKLGLESRNEERANYAKAADEAFQVLLRYLDTPESGFWYDQIQSDNSISGSSSKASSLYHIINAMDEYIQIRPKLEK